MSASLRSVKCVPQWSHRLSVADPKIADNPGGCNDWLLLLSDKWQRPGTHSAGGFPQTS